jgi:uncharacterized membrane protein
MRKLFLIFLVTFVLLVSGCLKESVQSEDTTDSGQQEDVVEGYDVGEIDDLDMDELDDLGDVEIPDDL